MKRIVIFAALLVLALISACGPDNPFAPSPSTTALTLKLNNPTTVKLSWNAIPDTDFSSYSIYRSSSSGIQSNPGAATVIAVIEEVTTAMYLDSDLEPGSFWYYAIKISNDGGGTSWSNEASIKIPSK